MLAVLTCRIHGEDFFIIKDRIIEDAWLKTSMFYIAPGLRLNNLGYNTNIYSYEYLETPDWTAHIRLDLDVAAIFKDRIIIQVKESPSYALYKDNDRERAFNNILQLTAYTWVGRFNIKYQLEKPYLYQQANPETGQRVRRWETHHTFSVDYGNQRRFFINVYARKRSVTYEDDPYMGSYNLNALFARTEYWGGVSINKVIFTQTRVTFGFDYYDNRYRYIPLRDGTGGQVSLAVRFPAGSRITGVLRYGLRFIRPNSSLYKDFVKPFGSGLLSIRLMDRISLNVNYRLDNRYSFAGADLYYDSQSIGGGFTFAFTPRLRFRSSINTGWRLYKSILSQDQTRRDTFNTYRVALVTRISDKGETGVEYRAYRADSTHLRFVRSYDYIGGYIRYDF
jgi:hypothetical protein